MQNNELELEDERQDKQMLLEVMIEARESFSERELESCKQQLDADIRALKKDIAKITIKIKKLMNNN